MGSPSEGMANNYDGHLDDFSARVLGRMSM